MSKIITELKIAQEMIRINLLNEMELRGSFFLLVVGMMINNIAFIFLWVLMFSLFGEINGWSGTEMIGLHGYVAIVYGVSYTFASGASKLVDYVNNGYFDVLMIGPRNLYLRVLTNHLRVSAVGDIIYGVIALIIYYIQSGISIGAFLALFSLMLPSVVIMISFMLVVSLVAFFVPDASDIAKSLYGVLFEPALYPAGLFQGVVRFILVFIVPSLVLSGFPIEVVRDVSVSGYIYIWFIAAVWGYLVYKLFYLYLRRYESGNLTGARSF